MLNNNKPTATTEDISSPVLGTLQATGSYVDNSLSESCSSLAFFQLVNRLDIRKKLGASFSQILFVILIAPIVKANSMWAFCSDFLSNLFIGEKDVIYRLLRREDIKWALLTRGLVRAFIKEHPEHFDSASEDEVAIVVDDSLKARTGKVEAAASHWDHNKKQAVRSHQVLALGLAFARGFLPVCLQICTGEKKRIERCKKKGFKDHRSEVAQSYQRALDQDKNTMFGSMVKALLRLGVKVKWVLGDSWYGTRGNIKMALDAGLEAIFLMKKSKMKYRFQGKLYSAKQLYQLFKRKMIPVFGGKFRAVQFEVEINLGSKKEPEWKKVTLMLSQPKHNHTKDGWVVCLCTDTDASTEKILKVYSLRWSIEVFFKECKQHLGWLNNQSADYVSTYASLHLAPIRYILLLHGALLSLDGAQSLSDLRRKQSKQMTLLNYLGLLWELLIQLVFGVLDNLKARVGAANIDAIKTELNRELDEFIENAFQFELNCSEPLSEVG